jgi:signal transduction histidine kinase
MISATRQGSGFGGACQVQSQLHPDGQWQPPSVAVIALRFSESLELPVVLDQIAREVASLFQGFCRVQFTPAQRPADSLCVVAIPGAPASTCTMAGDPAAYTELLLRLEEHRRAHAPALGAEPTDGQNAAPPGEGDPAADAGAELLLAPLVARGRRIGKIDVVIPAHSGSTLRHDQRLLRELAAHAALAIDTADMVAQRRPAAGAEAGTAAERDVGQLLAMLAHDLRAPLSTLSTSVQMLVREAKGSLEPNAERLALLVEVAEASVAQLDAQVSALPRRPGADAPPDACSREAIDLVRLTQLMAHFYQQTTGRHRLRVSAEVSELFGHWVRSHLERVLGNVLLNAIKYSPEGGEIRIGVGYDEDALGRWATLSIQNRGPGIPLQDLPGLSQPGYRGQNVGAIPGTGFGLASVRDLVEQQGGSFAIQSEVGRSTTVLVRLPI